MKIIKADIWDYYAKGYHVVVPTNGWINHDGMNPMGKGIALQARRLFSKIEYCLGAKLKRHGNHVFYWERQKLFTFPTKENWRDDAKLELIDQSCRELKKYIGVFPDVNIVMPKIGCGWGRLSWEQVKPVVEKYFGELTEEKFVIVDNESGDSKEWRGDNKEDVKGDEYNIFGD